MPDFFDELDNALSNSFNGESDESDFLGVAFNVAQAHKGQIDSFTIGIRNRTGQAKKIALFPGYYDTAKIYLPAGAAGSEVIKMIGGASLAAANLEPFILHNDPSKITAVEACDAVLDDGYNGVIYGTDSTHTITVSSEEFAIREFLKFIASVPSVVKDIVINADDQAVFASTMKVKRLSPFESEGSYTIKMTDFLSENQNIDRKITINPLKKYGRVLQLDNQTLLLLNIPGTINGTPDVGLTIQFNLERKYDISEINMQLALAAAKRAGTPATPVARKSAIKK